jgi:hypothetical protein
VRSALLTLKAGLVWSQHGAFGITASKMAECYKYDPFWAARLEQIRDPNRLASRRPQARRYQRSIDGKEPSDEDVVPDPQLVESMEEEFPWT